MRTHLSVAAYGAAAEQMVAGIVLSAAETMSDPADFINRAVEALETASRIQPVGRTKWRRSCSVPHGTAPMIFFKQLTIWLASGVEAGAAVIIGLAAIEATIRSLILFVPTAHRAVHPGVRQQDAKEAVRLRLGRWLAVALEFELAADILRTAVAPTWNEIGQLAAIVVLRTVLNYFLQQEIDKAEARHPVSVHAR